MEYARAIGRILTDADADDRVETGVVDAFRHVCESQLGPVFSYIRYRVESADVAEELTSTTFLKALEGLHSFDPARGDLTGWIFGIARHLVTDHLRSHRRWAIVPIDWLSELSSSDATPEQVVDHSEMQAQLVRAIRRLRHRHRDVLGLRFGAGLTNREIARVMRLHEGHVSVLISRALARLKAHLALQGVTHV